MAGKPIKVEDNLACLKLFSEKLKGLEHFVFFGTMLGLVRDGQPIKGDDDVDFYVNKKHYRKIIKIIEEIGLVPLEAINDCFVNTVGYYKKQKIAADFYFYDTDTDEDHILEYWNFDGKPHIKENVLKTPKALVYPIVAKKYQGVQVNMPKEARVLCEYLYSSEWRQPLAKGSQYRIIIYQGKPYFFRRDNFWQRLSLLCCKKLKKSLSKKSNNIA